jgi:formylglycine-generating enzyme required for sulfatase activity
MHIPVIVGIVLCALLAASDPVRAQPTPALSDNAVMTQDRERSRHLAPAERDRALKLFDGAFALYQAGDFDAAKAGFERGLGIFPANGQANFYLGDILARRGDQEGARARYERAKFFEPDTPEGLKAEVALGKLPPPPQPEPPIKPMVAGMQDCPQCPRMVRIPGGTFVMGTPPTERDRKLAEGPQHQVSVRPFLLGIYAVTFAEWDACAADGGCNAYRPYDAGWGRGQRPVINVSWNDAYAYTQWLGRKTGQRYHLPTEAEWEFAARAGSTTVRYWGEEIGRGKAVCEGCGSYWDNKSTAPVGQFPSNAFGLYDMLGNVWQWVEDCWNENYQRAPVDGAAWTTGECSSRVARGGSWDYVPRYVRAGNRFGVETGIRVYGSGFRVARTL